MCLGALRLLGVLLLLAIGLALVLYLLTRNRRFLTFAWRTFQLGVVLLIVALGVLVLERLLLRV
jgi:hypothetical protein